MAKLRAVLQQILLDSYVRYHDLYPAPEDCGELPLVSRAEYHEHAESYALVKKAKLYGVDNNDYVYIYSLEQLDADMAAKCIDYALRDGLARVKPHNEHMSSDVTAVFLAGEVTDDAVSYIKKRKFYKSYRFTLQGWTRLKIAAADVGRERVIGNGDGRKIVKFIKNLLFKE